MNEINIEWSIGFLQAAATSSTARIREMSTIGLIRACVHCKLVARRANATARVASYYVAAAESNCGLLALPSDARIDVLPTHRDTK